MQHRGPFVPRCSVKEGVVLMLSLGVAVSVELVYTEFLVRMRAS